MAERVGFEPTVPRNGTPVFETDAFSHSATSPLNALLPDNICVRTLYSGKKRIYFRICCQI